MEAPNFTLEGQPQLETMLDGLPRHIRFELLKRAIAPAGELVRAAIAALAPVSTGNLRDSIILRMTQVGGEASGVVLPNRKLGGGGRHAHLVERGTQPHVGKYFGHEFPHPGTPARPFFFRGAEAAAPAALDSMERNLGEGVDAYWAAQGGGEE